MLSVPKNRYASGKPITDWVLAQTIDLEKLLAYHEGVHLTGLNVKRDKEGWFVLLKGDLNGKAMVHFSGARYYSDVWENIAYEVTHGNCFWRPDKYAEQKRPPFVGSIFLGQRPWGE